MSEREENEKIELIVDILHELHSHQIDKILKTVVQILRKRQADAAAAFGASASGAGAFGASGFGAGASGFGAAARSSATRKHPRSVTVYTGEYRNFRPKLITMPTPGDGACFFHAVAMSRGGSTTANEYRREFAFTMDQFLIGDEYNSQDDLNPIHLALGDSDGHRNLHFDYFSDVHIPQGINEHDRYFIYKDAFIQKISQPNTYMDEHCIGKFAEFNPTIGILLFQQRAKTDLRFNKQADLVICMELVGEHFSALWQRIGDTQYVKTFYKDRVDAHKAPTGLDAHGDF